MADKCDLCLLGLIILSSLLTGTSGVNDENVFISSGENVRLPCNNALSDCTSSTTWIYYNSVRHSVAVELITKGIKKKDTERHERLSLGSDCSLNIKNVTEEDSGFYSCQQWTGPKRDQKQGPDARVSLHVLHAEDDSTTAVIPVHITNSTRNTPETTAQDDTRTAVTNSTTNTQVAVISVAAVAVFLLAVLWLICRKTADSKRGTVDSAVKDENEHKGTYETINTSIPPAARANEQTDDHVTYSEVTFSNKKPVKSVDDHIDTVTYAAIR
ncbi:uncharacterized protein LOC127509574 isoform X1 [Ctenopharyngodon idella]|uniref:uncharacterized protein LOC127508192 isoform X1 n=1 Tax=Ctenopharyngodon idella TaxID=7959 RepID=UPI00223280B5|nr:uncharacterized protein LOC127508192 isoform X1 [Ctenopharyngodon idella]XP_051741896.1 uncharacterized protein LOC127508192 isoform X2 [Ctenopharyngodon idella]XP_051744378.1 uncharacterized protein LOC127509574 isoform X1 [Ctenopharyngodon idella]